MTDQPKQLRLPETPKLEEIATRKQGLTFELLPAFVESHVKPEDFQGQAIKLNVLCPICRASMLYIRDVQLDYAAGCYRIKIDCPVCKAVFVGSSHWQEYDF